MEDEYLTRCVVNVIKKTVYIYSNEGSEKQITFDSIQEFTNVLRFIRETVDQDILFYSNAI